MRILALTLALLLAPAVADAPMKQYIPPAKPITQQRAKQEPKKMVFELTAYTASDKNMNGQGITTSGRKAVPWRTVAASRHHAIGTRIYFPQLKRTVVVHDRFASAKKEKELRIPANRLDLYVGLKNRTEALQFGRRKLEGVILE